jgi:predicted NBD/HSP70 family sugar kinase
MFFYYGTGVGLGLAIAHEAVRGATNNAGDAGHIIDSAATAIFEAMADRVAVAVVTVANLLDLDTVVFGGPYWNRVSPLVLGRVSELVNSSTALVTTHPIAVAVSRIGDDVAAVGAACLVLDDVLSPRPSALLISG